MHLLSLVNAVADPEGDRSTPSPSIFRYPMKMKWCQRDHIISFHGISKKAEIKLAMRTPYEPRSRNPGSLPAMYTSFAMKFCSEMIWFTYKMTL